MNSARFILTLCATAVVLLSCSRSMPDWLLEADHAISPDGKAAIFQVQDGNRVSVSTWVISDYGGGGGGVFDITASAAADVKLSWLSDSTAQIVYPHDAEVLRQEDSSYFAGRVVFIRVIRENP